MRVQDGVTGGAMEEATGGARGDMDREMITDAGGAPEQAIGAALRENSGPADGASCSLLGRSIGSHVNELDGILDLDTRSSVWCSRAT